MIKISDLKFTIEDKEILSHINLNIKDGTIFGIIGPNGVGKTTLLRCIAGIYDINCGEILYDEKKVYDNIAVKEKIGYVADENIFPLSFKVESIVKYYKMTYKNFDSDKFNELNKIFCIPLNKYIFQLSKGMKMRLSIMLAFSIKAKYLILDEPTSGLDVILKKKLLKIFSDEVYENKTTIIISSHHLDELERICDEVAIINEGKITYENSIDNMKNKIKKIQAAFNDELTEEDFRKLSGTLKIEKVGRVYTIITEEYDENFIKTLNSFNPLFIEEINLSLEDVFIYKVDKEDEHEKIL